MSLTSKPQIVIGSIAKYGTRCNIQLVQRSFQRSRTPSDTEYSHQLRLQLRKRPRGLARNSCFAHCKQLVRTQNCCLVGAAADRGLLSEAMQRRAPQSATLQCSIERFQHTHVLWPSCMAMNAYTDLAGLCVPTGIFKHQGMSKIDTSLSEQGQTGKGTGYFLPLISRSTRRRRNRKSITTSAEVPEVGGQWDVSESQPDTDGFSEDSAVDEQLGTEGSFSSRGGGRPAPEITSYSCSSNEFFHNSTNGCINQSRENACSSNSSYVVYPVASVHSLSEPLQQDGSRSQPHFVPVHRSKPCATLARTPTVATCTTTDSTHSYHMEPAVVSPTAAAAGVVPHGLMPPSAHQPLIQCFTPAVHLPSLQFFTPTFLELCKRCNNGCNCHHCMQCRIQLHVAAEAAAAAAAAAQSALAASHSAMAHPAHFQLMPSQAMSFATAIPAPPAFLHMPAPAPAAAVAVSAQVLPSAVPAPPPPRQPPPPPPPSNRAYAKQAAYQLEKAAAWGFA